MYLYIQINVTEIIIGVSKTSLFIYIEYRCDKLWKDDKVFYEVCMHSI